MHAPFYTHHTVNTLNVLNAKILSQQQCDVTGIYNGGQERDERPSRCKFIGAGEERAPATVHQPVTRSTEEAR